MQTPSVGRIVHYHDGTETFGEPQAAIITSVPCALVISKRWPTLIGDGIVSLTVFATDRPAPYSIEPVPYSETPKAGHWNYPPRVG